MKINAIKAILLQEFFITKRSLEVLFDLFFFSTMTVIVFGFTSLFLTGRIHSASAYYLIMGIILWEVIRVSQYSITVGCLWNIWSRNLSNMFISPLTLKEYVFSLMLSACIKSITTFFLVGVISALAFGFNIFNLGVINISLFLLNLILFSWAVGLILLGFILLFGTRIQALAWGLIFIFQPLSASFFPVKILPGFIQPISYLLPSTYVFEGARFALDNGNIAWNLFSIGLAENLIYLILAAWLFNVMFNRSKDSGQFARNEG